MIVWNGISSKDVGVVVEHYPGIILPKRKVEVIQVPGRNGDIVIEQEAFENYEQSYQVFLDEKNYGGLESAMPKIANWLMGSYGYKKLEDSYFPEFYRMAYVANGAQFSSWFNIYGEGTLTFNCAPQKFYKSGEREIEINSGDTLHNPSGFWAEPIITIAFSGQTTATLTFTTNGVAKNVIFTSGSEPFTAIVDVHDHTVVDGYNNEHIAGTNFLLGLYESMKLGSDTIITWEGNITSLKIKPRWWTI